MKQTNQPYNIIQKDTFFLDCTQAEQYYTAFINGYVCVCQKSMGFAWVPSWNPESRAVPST